MRRSQLVLLSVLVTAGAAGRADAQAVIVSATAPTGASSNEVVARLLSFDLNHDGKVETNELAERMRGVVARGDVDGDGALDGSEVHALATTLPPRTQVFEPQFRYAFADQTGLSSRLHLERSLEDLRLEPATKEQALTVIRTYVDALEDTASADLLTWLKVYLPRDQLLEVSEALALQRRRSKSGFNSSQLLERIDGFKIGPIERRMAVAEIGLYEDRLRLRDIERAELLEQLKDILTSEERENFRAAIARRPLASVGVIM